MLARSLHFHCLCIAFFIGVFLFVPRYGLCENVAVQVSAPGLEVTNSQGFQSDKTYTLGIGDELKMTVYGEPELSNSYKVSSDGTISVPLIGDVALSGLELSEAEGMITEKLSAGYLIEPSVSLEVSTSRPFYIIGEVRRPGSYSYVDNMTALQAVAIAGGFTYRARQNRVKIKKSDGHEDVRPADARIVPGDVVVVQERLF